MWQKLSLRARLNTLLALVMVLGLVINIARLLLEAGPRVAAEDQSVVRLARGFVETLVSDLNDAPDPDARLDQIVEGLKQLRHVSITREPHPAASRPPAASVPSGAVAEPRQVPEWFLALIHPERTTVDVPIAANGRSLGSLVITSHPTDEISEIWDGIITQIEIGSAIALALLLITMTVVNRALAPIKSLADAMGAIEAADVDLDCSVTEEACPLNLAPTASTTAALAIGDALAMTLLVQKGFKEEDFANLHPGGTLGKRLMQVESLMHAGAQCPAVMADTCLADVMAEMSAKDLGMTCVVDADTRLLGIITDGDLRRHMPRAVTFLGLSAADVMTRDPISVWPRTLAAEALNIMEQRKITSIVVVDKETRRVAGVVQIHDLWRIQMF